MFLWTRSTGSSHSSFSQVDITRLILLHVREGKRPAWTEEEEEELRKLYEEHRHSEGLPFVRTSFVFVVCKSLNTVSATSRVLHLFLHFLCLVPDIVETLLPLLSNSTRTRRQVVTQLVRMGLVDNAKELKKQKYVLGRVQTALFVFRA